MKEVDKKRYDQLYDFVCKNELENVANTILKLEHQNKQMIDVLNHISTLMDRMTTGNMAHTLANIQSITKARARIAERYLKNETL